MFYLAKALVVFITSAIVAQGVVLDSRACGPPNVNPATVDLIKDSEAFVDSPKPDPVGFPTVGYGHKCQSKDCSEAHVKFPMSKDQANQLLLADLKEPQTCLYNDIKQSVKLNENQYGALVSWTFNEGCHQVGTSDLVKQMNAGKDPTQVATDELPKWDKGGGKVLPGLTKRRAAELRLFKTASPVIAHPCQG